MQNQNENYRERAENDRADEADSAPDVEFPLRVIPPSGVEQLFHQPRGKIFQTARQNRTREEEQHGILDSAQYQQHQHRTRAVDRAVRAVQKAAIDELSLANGADGTLIHPADDAVDHQPEEPCFDCLHAASSLVLQLFIFLVNAVRPLVSDNLHAEPRDTDV